MRRLDSECYSVRERVDERLERENALANRQAMLARLGVLLVDRHFGRSVAKLRAYDPVAMPHQFLNLSVETEEMQGVDLDLDRTQIVILQKCHRLAQRLQKLPSVKFGKYFEAVFLCETDHSAEIIRQTCGLDIARQEIDPRRAQIGTRFERGPEILGIDVRRYWDGILPGLEAASGSLSRPSFPIHGPRSTKITSHSSLPRARLEALSRFKFCLVTDVSRCFPSIYTHSIPWAVHDKAASKEDTKSNSATIFGNRLDFAVRQAQDRQTIGIPVGPDTSRVISEIILSAVDREFIRRSGTKGVTYRRHVDDYWIGGASVEECERHLQILREALREYELDINELKTRIVNTSVVFAEAWAFEVAEELGQAFPSHGQPRGDQVATLGKILERARSTNDDGVIRHAIRKLDERHSWNMNWNVLEHFLAQCAVQYPHSFDYVARVVAWRLRKGFGINTTLWGEVTRQVAGQASTLGRDSEVLWSLWLMKELNLKVNKAMSSLMIRTNSPIVSAFLAHMHAHGLTTDRQIRSDLWSNVEGNHFTGPFWPLTLELLTLGHAKPAALDDGGGDDIVKKLHANGGTLFDWGAAPAVFERTERQDDDDWLPDLGPEEAIEDYTSDYDDDDEESDDDEDGADDENPNPRPEELPDLDEML